MVEFVAHDEREFYERELLIMRRQAKVDRWLVGQADPVDVAPPAESRPPEDPGLAQIDELERPIVLGRVQLLEWNQVPADEAARERVAVEKIAAAVCDQLRQEYLSRNRP